MPKARSYWKGFLRLSLVSIPVEIYNAVDTKSEIAFRQIHKPTGRRITYTKTVPGIGEVDNADIVKGYEVDQDTYVTLDPDEIEAVRLESKKTIDLVKFIDAKDIDPRYYERPYYVLPADENAAEGYVVIRNALQKTGKAGLAQVTMHGREHLTAVSALEDGIVLNIIRYADELRKPGDYFDEVPSTKPDKELVDLAVELIERKSGKFTPEQFKDHYAAAVHELVRKKMRGQKIVAPHEEGAHGGAKVIDLMQALKKSVGDRKARGARPAGKAATKKQA